MAGENNDYGLRVQIAYIKQMFNENLTPREMYNRQTPLHVSERTIYSWWEHFNEYGEAPFHES